MKVKMKELLPVVADYYNTQPSDILSISKLAKHTKPRQVFCWLCRLKLEKTYPEIGRFLKRDHTTIIHAVRKCREEKWISWELADELMQKAKEGNSDD